MAQSTTTGGPPLQIPLDRYVLLRELDVGGMASVYLARRSTIGGFRRLLVVKRIRPDLASNPLLVAAFLEEARLTALMRHPNVISVYDLLVEEELPCMILEFVHGRVASVVAQRGSELGRPLTPVLTVSLLLQALEGLSHAHEMTDEEGTPLHLIHRDISPQNILMGFDGVVRLFDFGIAQTRQQAERNAGVLSGKSAYLSPEQCQGGALDARSDLFGMGIILFELLTQSRLFKRSNPIQTLAAVVEEPIPPPRSLNPDIPAELERITLRALERDPAARYASAREMADDLLSWLTGCGQPWGTRVLSRYLAELFQEEITTEWAEHQRFLYLPRLVPLAVGEPAESESAPPAAPVRDLLALKPPEGRPGPGAGEKPGAREGVPRGLLATDLIRAVHPSMTRAGTEPLLLSQPEPPQGRPLRGQVDPKTASQGTELLTLDPGPLIPPVPISWLGSFLAAAGLVLFLVFAAALIVRLTVAF